MGAIGELSSDNDLRSYKGLDSSLGGPPQQQKACQEQDGGIKTPKLPTTEWRINSQHNPKRVAVMAPKYIPLGNPQRCGGSYSATVLT